MPRMAFHLSIVVDSLALLALVLLLVAFDQRRKRQTFRYPPGPKPLPILGNLFDVPKESSWLKYTEWSKTYGRSCVRLQHHLVLTVMQARLRLCKSLEMSSSSSILLELLVIFWKRRVKSIRDAPLSRFMICGSKQCSIYCGPGADRRERMNWSWLITTMQYSDTWRHRRRMLDRSLRPNAAIQYRPMLRSKAHDFLKHMISRPEDFRRHIEQ